MPTHPSLSADVDFDVAVVGAGPAGSAAALRCAQQGLNVVLIERGSAPGSKNLSGGVLYSQVLAETIPAFAVEAPFERVVTRNVTTFLNATSSVSIDYDDERLREEVNAVACGQSRRSWRVPDARHARGLSGHGSRPCG